MEQDDKTLISPLLAIGDKRPIINDSDGFDRESKRQCMQPFGYNHDDGSTTKSSYIRSSWEAQNSDFSGSCDTLYQPDVDTDLLGHFEPQYSSGLPLLSDLLGFSPGYPTYETFSGVISAQSSEVETYAPESGNSIEGFTDESPFKIVTQTDPNLDIGCLFNGISQEEISVIEKPSAAAIKKNHAHEASNPPSLWDGYASIPLQVAGDCPPNSEGDKMSQEMGEPMSQSSGLVTLERISEVVCNEKTYLGQPINVHLLRPRIGHRI